jgi:hypothetical protein
MHEEHEARITRSFIYFSARHLIAATDTARLAYDLERQPHSQLIERQHRALVYSGIILTIGFLEANINELFGLAEGDFGDNYPDAVRNWMAPLDIKIFGQARRHFKIRELLPKYQWALFLTGKPEFAEGSEPMQTTKLIVQLRNTLVHAPGEWRNVETLARHPLEGKFQENQLMRGCSETREFFPDRCLGYGCLAWAITNARCFADEFHRRLAHVPFIKACNSPNPYRPSMISVVTKKVHGCGSSQRGWRSSQTTHNSAHSNRHSVAASNRTPLIGCCGRGFSGNERRPAVPGCWGAMEQKPV